ncbi:MAG TPA: UvrD-helicase domain-containing protein [Thermoleophilaceae bacterium]|nr:UvrD-helicase domain-containing protein [Thermoleophilaceae bacterium]
MSATRQGAEREAVESRVAGLLEGLNEPQREAVTHGEGPLLILAGAGSGKTRALTRRIAYLVGTGQARASEILAITFTNKAAAEMRARVQQLVGNQARAMWVMTFHSACARILRADADKLNYTRGFTIYDEADSVRLVKQCIEELGVDPKRYAPRAVKRQISDAKSQLLDAAAYKLKVGGYFEQTVAEVYELYEKRIHAMNAMDFDDLLLQSVRLFQMFPEVLERYRRSFRHVLVDEYQDTNHAQYSWLRLLADEHRNLCVVGDEDQCLVEGTLITMGDGSTKPIEDVQEGDEVLSCFGSGDFRPAKVSETFRSSASNGIAITTRSGQRLISTPEHVHFAGYHRTLSPKVFLTYAMMRYDKGFRVGTTRTYPNRPDTAVNGIALRTLHEHADASWVVSVHDSEAEARAAEIELSLRYRLPTLPFTARKGGSQNGLVHDQQAIDDIFAGFPTMATGLHLLADHGLSFEHPHNWPQSHEGRRRNVTLTLCGSRRGRTVMHGVAVGGRDPIARTALETFGFKIRPAKAGVDSWRHETAYKDYGRLLESVDRMQSATPLHVRQVARFGSRKEMPGKTSLPFIPAASVRKGMVMFTAGGGCDVVEHVEPVEIDVPVYDLNIESTHNFVANGLVTHNSVYRFRHADIRNILDFEHDFPDAAVIKLEQNYRSTQTILDAANGVIRNNRERIGKNLWTDQEGGEPVRLRELEDEHAEARYVAGEIERHVEGGGSRNDVAVFYRTNAQSRVLEDTLVRYGVSYQVIGGTKFYDRAEIKDALAYLTLLTNPHDVVSFGRIVNSPRRGIGQTSQARIISHANTIGEPIFDVASHPEDVPGLGAAAVKAVGRFMETMEKLRDRADGARVGDLVNDVLHEVGYFEALEKDRSFESQGRIENLEELVGVAREYDAARGGALGGVEDDGGGQEPSVEEFLQQIALFSQQDDLSDDEGVVTLMTLHNAKGLEYDVVFMIGCEDGVFPHSRSIEAGDVEEERRLCYVGMTRARKELTVTHARTRALYGAREWNVPSRFLAEIPVELTDAAEEGAVARATSWSGGGTPGFGGPDSAWESRRRDPQIPATSAAAVGAHFNVGEDVVHAKFGEGVVTAVEAGGIVMVRFAGVGEKKLMADYAPLKRKGD